MVLTNQLIYLVNIKTIRKIFYKLCVLLKKSKLYRYYQGDHLGYYSLHWKVMKWKLKW